MRYYSFVAPYQPTVGAASLRVSRDVRRLRLHVCVSRSAMPRSPVGLILLNNIRRARVAALLRVLFGLLRLFRFFLRLVLCIRLSRRPER